MRRQTKPRRPIRIPRELPSLSKLLFWRQPRLGSGPARRVRLALGRHRRALAVCLALLGLWVTIRSAVPAPPGTAAVLVAAQDLPAGHQLTPSDLRSRTWPAAAVPAGLLPAAAGQLLAAPIRAGELLTDARVVGPGLLAGQPVGTVAMVVRLGDPMAGALVGAGDRVDVLVSAQTTWDAAPDLADGTETLPAPVPASSEAASSGTASSGTASSGAASPVTGGSAGSTATDTTGGNRAAANTANSGSRAEPGHDGGAEAERVVAGALVLAAPGSGVPASGDVGGNGEEGSGADGRGGLAGLGGGDLNSGLGGGSGAADDGADRVIVLAVTPAQARRLAMAQTGKFVTIALLQRSIR